MRLPIRKIAIVWIIVMTGAVVLAQNGKSGFEVGSASVACLSGENALRYWQARTAVHPAIARRLGFDSLSGKQRGLPSAITEAARKKSVSKYGGSQKAPGFATVCPYSALAESAGLESHQPKSGTTMDQPDLPVSPTDLPRVGDDEWSTVRYWLVS
jgi:hypothetical protein